MPRPSKTGPAATFTGMRADYNAAKQSRFRRTRTGTSTQGSAADYHIRSDSELLRIMELARDFERNDVIFGAGVERLIDNVVQDGFRLEPNTGDEDINKRLRDRWQQWAEDADQCDVAGEHSFCMSEGMALRRTVVDGDILSLGLADGPLQWIEAHRIRSPTRSGTRLGQNVVHGVRLNQHRRRIGYLIADDSIDPYSTVLVRNLREVRTRDADGKRQVFHVYNPKRVTQTRGISAAAPIADTIGMHDDVQFAQLVKQQITSCFAIFRSFETEAPQFDQTPLGEQELREIEAGATRILEGIAPGVMLTGRPGEKLEGFSPNVPNAEFFTHAHLLLTFIAVNLGLPVAVLLLDPSNTNFSGWRGAIDQARTGFRRIQRWMIERFHSPAYRFKVRQWLAEPEFEDIARAHAMGEINAFGHAWHPPTWKYIEPLKDATTDVMRHSNTLTSPRRLHAERGCDWDDIARETVEDHVSAIRFARQQAAVLNAEFPDEQPVHWRELLPLPKPGGINLTISDGPAGPPESGQESAASGQGQGRPAALHI